jgi:repressor LexA
VLTEKQKNVFEFIDQFIKKWGYSPTYGEIQKHFGFKSVGTVQDYVAALEVKGFIQKTEGKWSSLRIINQSNEVPLLGKVAAGRPIEFFKFGEHTEVPFAMIKGKGEVFALQVSGDSMINEGILDGDIVIVKKESSAENGKIVVASVDNEATIKKLVKKRGQIELHSANPKYQPIIVKPHQEFRIEGIYTGLIRY